MLAENKANGKMDYSNSEETLTKIKAKMLFIKYSNFPPRTFFVFKLISKKATQDVCPPTYCFVCNITFYACLLLYTIRFH